MLLRRPPHPPFGHLLLKEKAGVRCEFATVNYHLPQYEPLVEQKTPGEFDSPGVLLELGYGDKLGFRVVANLIGAGF